MDEKELTRWRWENNPRCEFLPHCNELVDELHFTHQCLDPIGRLMCSHYRHMFEKLTPETWVEKLGLTVYTKVRKHE